MLDGRVSGVGTAGISGRSLGILSPRKWQFLEVGSVIPCMSILLCLLAGVWYHFIGAGEIHSL